MNDACKRGSFELETAQLTSASIISAAIHRDIAASSMDGV
jgi:hypothetical protein